METQGKIEQRKIATGKGSRNKEREQRHNLRIYTMNVGEKGGGDDLRNIEMETR